MRGKVALGWKERRPLSGCLLCMHKQESGGAVIELGKGDDCSVKLTGPNVSVIKARKAVVELLHLDAESVRAVEVPHDIVDAVLGQGAEHLRQLETRHQGRSRYAQIGPHVWHRSWG